MNLEELNNYVQNLEYENKRMRDFLNKLGYSSEGISDIIINSCDTITKVQVYATIHTTMNKFLDAHYDFSRFNPDTAS